MFQKMVTICKFITLQTRLCQCPLSLLIRESEVAVSSDFYGLVVRNEAPPWIDSVRTAQISFYPEEFSAFNVAFKYLQSSSVYAHV